MSGGVEYHSVAPQLGPQMMILNPQTGTLMTQTPMTAAQAQSHMLSANSAQGLLPQAQAAGLLGHQTTAAGLMQNHTGMLGHHTQGMLGAPLGASSATPLSITRIMPKVPAMATLPPIFSTPQFALDGEKKVD